MNSIWKRRIFFSNYWQIAKKLVMKRDKTIKLLMLWNIFWSKHFSKIQSSRFILSTKRKRNKNCFTSELLHKQLLIIATLCVNVFEETKFELIIQKILWTAWIHCCELDSFNFQNIDEHLLLNQVYQVKFTKKKSKKRNKRKKANQTRKVALRTIRIRIRR